MPTGRFISGAERPHTVHTGHRPSQQGAKRSDTCPTAIGWFQPSGKFPFTCQRPVSTGHGLNKTAIGRRPVQSSAKRPDTCQLAAGKVPSCNPTGRIYAYRPPFAAGAISAHSASCFLSHPQKMATHGILLVQQQATLSYPAAGNPAMSSIWQPCPTTGEI